MGGSIYLRGVRQNNLKNFDLEIPRDQLVVVTGLSGSGKSSLVFDTIFAEGQRRYIESLSSYARQFLGQMDKPDVDHIEGLSPSIAIDQKSTFHNPRSTVGTVTEIYDYFRLLYARIGHPHCPKCGRPIERQSIDRIVDDVLTNPQGSRVVIMAPVVRGKKGEYKKELDGYKKAGYLRVIIDGKEYMLDQPEPIILDKQVKHTISVVVDRIVIKPNIHTRLTDSMETAIKLADGLVITRIDEVEKLYSTLFACPDCGVNIEEIEPRLFSFNTGYGACPACTGLGYSNSLDVKKLIVDDSLSLRDGAIVASGWGMEGSKIALATFTALGKKYGFSIDTPFKDLSEDAKNVILYGTPDKITIDYNSYGFSGQWDKHFYGVVNNIMRRYQETESEAVKAEFEKLMIPVPCKKCKGRRLNENALSVTINDKNIMDLCDLSVQEIDTFINSLRLTNTEGMIAGQILKEIKSRLRFLLNVGLDYLTLSRSSTTLSGGEAQRIRLATQIGSGLTGVLYVLDEPSIGLHQRDNMRLIETLKNLRDLGNSVLVVEHDEDTIRNADYIVDIGPGAGRLGGEVVAKGTLEDILNCHESLTGAYLRGDKAIDVPTERRAGNGHSIVLKGCRQNNLKNLTVEFPLGKFLCVTGVSGSGKSSLINCILYPALANALNKANISQGNFDTIEGLEYVDKVICIDQSPIGRTPRSNPATYTEVFTLIRNLFANTQAAKARGYNSGRFSFNVKGGRCEHCKGDGILTIEMNFMPDVYVPCEVCKGKRYNRETLEVRYKDKNIYEVLDMTVAEAVTFFENVPSIYTKMKTLFDVGLGYIKLGQPATTLSGGEAQRVKLATELAKRSTGKTVYILDEPTTGLHIADSERLIYILNQLVDAGNTVIVIEHNMDVIKVADHIIDLGKEGGDKGGNVICCGTPEQVSENAESYTGQFLLPVLRRGAERRARLSGEIDQD